jgi:hypothetical protein
MNTLLPSFAKAVTLRGMFFFFISRPVRVRITVYQSDELDFVILAFFRINIEFYGLTGNY